MLRPEQEWEIPELTQQIARAAFYGNAGDFCRRGVVVYLQTEIGHHGLLFDERRCPHPGKRFTCPRFQAKSSTAASGRIIDRPAVAPPQGKRVKAIIHDPSETQLGFQPAAGVQLCWQP